MFWSFACVSPIIDRLLHKFAGGQTQTGGSSLLLLQADGKADEGNDVGDQDDHVSLVDGVHLDQDVQHGHLLPPINITLYPRPLALVVPHVDNLDDKVNQTNRNGTVEKHGVEYSALPQ